LWKKKDIYYWWPQQKHIASHYCPKVELFLSFWILTNKESWKYLPLWCIMCILGYKDVFEDAKKFQLTWIFFWSQKISIEMLHKIYEFFGLCYAIFVNVVLKEHAKMVQFYMYYQFVRAYNVMAYNVQACVEGRSKSLVNFCIA